MLKQRSCMLNDEGVLLCGYYKKLKTMKKKFFLLYNETPCKAARIEYYDNEKKYKSGFNPKRIIKIKNCFNINRRLYTKHDFVIVLASKEGAFGIVMDTEEEMNIWLSRLLDLQRLGESSFDYPKFEYVWQVTIQRKGVAEQHNLFGNHHICLSNKSVTFIKIAREKYVSDKKTTKVEVLLTTIRRCGDSQCYFYMEIGRQSSLGPGELWMETEDSLTAQDMHKMILSKMVSLNEALVEPMRKRSSSATEATNISHDRKSSYNIDIANNSLLNAQNFCRDRCDSLPSRNRTSSDCSNPSIRMVPTTSNNPLSSFHNSSSCRMGYSASEESVSVDDSEESMGISYLLSSRAPEDAIPEECIFDGLNIQKGEDITDMNDVNVPSKEKAKINLIKQRAAAKNIDLDNQSHFSLRTYSFGSNGENDFIKDALVNRVRAFSVGSRIKCSRICSKTSPKLFNSDNIKNNFVETSSRKSISVPALANKNIQSVDQMGDLMEIDFSKPINNVLKANIKPNKKECKDLVVAAETIHKNTRNFESGYLEMKPITQTPNHITSQLDQKDILDNSNLIDRSLHSANNDVITDEHTLTTSNNPTCGKNEFETNLDTSSPNQDLYYASLDLPKSGNTVNTRYEFKESLNNLNIGGIENEYAKINFDQPETLCSLKKNVKFQ